MFFFLFVGLLLLHTTVLKSQPIIYLFFFVIFFIFNYRLGFISQWGALAGRYAALCPPGWPWTSSQASQISAANATGHRMPFHSPSNGEFTRF